MITELATPTARAIGFELSGKLHDEDYQVFVPKVDAALEAGTTRLLARFHDFEGRDLPALWDDIKFATTHCTKLDRIALVGENKWEGSMAKVCQPFTMAKLRYFEANETDAAWQWLAED